MARQASGPSQRVRDRGHEPNAFSTRFVISAGAGLFTLIVAALVLMAVLFRVLSSDVAPEIAVPASMRVMRQPSALPPLDPNERDELTRIRAAEDQLLTTYAWLDADHQVARIPVERAIEILVEAPAENHTIRMRSGLISTENERQVDDE